MEPGRVQIAALVADAAGTELTINAGAAAGVIMGESYDVLRPGREIRDPQTGRLIRRSTTPVGTLRITEVGDGWAVGVLSGGPAQVGDCVDTCPLDEPQAVVPATPPAVAESESPPAPPAAVEPAPARPIGPFTWTPYQFRGTERFRYEVRSGGGEQAVSRFYTIDLQSGSLSVTVEAPGEETRTRSRAVGPVELADLGSLVPYLGLGPLGMALFLAPWWTGVPREWSPGLEHRGDLLFRVENGCEHAGQRGARGRVYHMDSNVLTACVSPDVPMPLAVWTFFPEWIEARLVEYRP
jgi:hypothetical protein